MIPAGQIVENVLRAANRTTSSDKRAEVWQILNAMYFQLCREHPWAALRAYTDLDFTTSGGVGMWLPANLFGVRRVFDLTNDIEFAAVDATDVDPEENEYRYYREPGDNTDLFFDDEMSVNKGDSTFTCSALTADHTGEYVRFNTEMGFYLLTAAKTFEPVYNGPTLDTKEIRIRPKETEKLFIIDSNEEQLDDRTVRVHYWKAPAPLYLDSDMPCIPSANVLELMVLQVVPEARARRPVSQQDVDEAKRLAKSVNPDNPRPSRPRDVHGKKFSLTGGGYGRR